mgnify:CR=1 FL=1
MSKIFKNYGYYENLKLISYVKDRMGHDEKYSLDNKKIKKIGWQEKTDLARGIRKTIKWYFKKNEF